MSLLAPSPLSAFEQERLDRIAENRRRMEAMGVLDTARDLAKTFKTTAKPPIQKPRVPKEKRQKRHQPVRRSRRLSGVEAEFAEIREDEGVTYSDFEPGLDDLLADGVEVDSMPEEKQQQFQEMRCGSAGRGSMYDSAVGITCHFCRQKKLCGEEGCPRCSRRSASEECIGKSDCSRCHSATGRFCRACLLIRYGENLEDVRKAMKEGTWLCPHCYEDEHPDEGWMCNSSICMKRRGYKPTGIAIYDAQQRGFPSVAHWLQAQLQKRSTGAGSSDSSSNTVAAAAAKAGSVKAAAAKEGSVEPTSSSDSSSSAKDQVVAPSTPLRGTENVEGVSASAGGKGRVTRAGAGAASKENAVGGAEGAAKRACVGDNAGTRRSLRFRK